MINEFDLINAWHSTDTREQIGRRLDITDHKVRKEFERLVRIGMVPDGRRKHVKRAWSEPAQEDERYAYTDNCEITVGSDLLLSRLIEIHGSEDRFARDTAAPGAWNDG